jgi:hypothetical protein
MRELAWLLATDPDVKVRDGQEAVRLAEGACDLTQYRQYWVVDVLAAAYAESGQFGKAVETAKKAVDLARAVGQPSAERDIQKRLELYQAGKPYRRP